MFGADILNVVFVAGAAAAVRPKGLEAPPDFFRSLFPAMLFILLVFRSAVFVPKDKLNRPFGAVLLGAYAIAVVSYGRCAY